MKKLNLLAKTLLAVALSLLLIACSESQPKCEKTYTHYLFNRLETPIRYTSFSKDSIIFDRTIEFNDSVLLYKLIDGDTLIDFTEYLFSDSIIIASSESEVISKITRIFTRDHTRYIVEFCAFGKDNFVHTNQRCENNCCWQSVYIWNIDSLYMKNYTDIDTCYEYIVMNPPNRYHWVRN